MLRIIIIVIVAHLVLRPAALAVAAAVAARLGFALASVLWRPSPSLARFASHAAFT